MMRVWTRMANAMRDVYGVGTDEYPIAEVGEENRLRSHHRST